MESNFNCTKYSLLIFLFGFLIPGKVASQVIPKRSIALNVTGMLFNDFSVYYEVTKSESKIYGLSIGYMISNNWWKGPVDGSTGGNEINDDQYPIGEYNGPQLRVCY